MPIHRSIRSFVGVLAIAVAAATSVCAAEPAQDEAVAYAIGVQACVAGFPMTALYRTPWETSFDPKRGHDRTVDESCDFRRLVTSADDRVVTPNEDTIGSRDGRAERDAAAGRDAPGAAERLHPARLAAPGDPDR
jgi:hypothetical protein